MKPSLTIHAHRDGSQSRDRAILDLLHLEELGLAPSSVTVQQLRKLWGCSQPMVSRRMTAIHQLGRYWVSAGWGRYKVFSTHERRAQRWEAARRQLQEVVG